VADLQKGPHVHEELVSITNKCTLAISRRRSLTNGGSNLQWLTSTSTVDLSQPWSQTMLLSISATNNHGPASSYVYVPSLESTHTWVSENLIDNACAWPRAFLKCLSIASWPLPLSPQALECYHPAPDLWPARALSSRLAIYPWYNLSTPDPCT
jgi:hypothetical protein